MYLITEEQLVKIVDLLATGKQALDNVNMYSEVRECSSLIKELESLEPIE